MCNAWNHPPGCRCGWGGDGHTGKSSGNLFLDALRGRFSGIPPIDKSKESYTIPNATCPVCGDLVFFYQSPEGGRVFFDELGPPWPKHPCTDSKSRPGQIADISIFSSHRDGYSWQKEGWVPYFINVVTRVDQNIIKLSGEFEGLGKVVFTKRHLSHGFGDGDKITSSCIAFLKINNDGSSLLSYISERGNEVNAACYKDALDIRSGESLRGAKAQRKKNRKGRRR